MAIKLTLNIVKKPFIILSIAKVFCFLLIWQTDLVVIIAILFCLLEV